MVCGPWINCLAWCRMRLPGWISLGKWRPKMNFITIHYTYIIVMTLLISVILYGNGKMRYIDALFFATGCATQSGLNTIDVNTLPLYQQLTMYFCTCVCTPIWIHTSVVVVRLYWFEKRFQHVAIDRSGRRSRSISRSKSDLADRDRSLGQEERAVGDREIRVMRSANGHANGGHIKDEDGFKDANGEAIRSDRQLGVEDKDDLFPEDATVQQVGSNVVWADDVSAPKERERLRRLGSGDSTSQRLPQKNRDQSIAFVEAQRQQKHKGTLRIPGPRDYERGSKPEEVDDENGRLDRVASNTSQDSHPGLNRSNSVPMGALGHDDNAMKNHITIDVPDRQRPATGSVYNRAKTIDDVIASSSSGGLRSRSKTRTFGSLSSRSRTEDEHPMPYFSWTPTIIRNSNFVDLTEEQREELGGIEYRALKLLLLILSVYFFGFHILGGFCLSIWSANVPTFTAIPKALGVNPWWWGWFTSASMFNDLGFTLTPDSMISYQQAVFPLLLGTFLIIIGNTGFPCMLRFLIWLLSKVIPRDSAKWEELKFLLDHPRRCFTLLFPSKANWWLFWVLIGLNSVDLIFFIILDLTDPIVTSIPAGYRFLDGLFQAASTRTAGFAVVNIAALHPAIQVSYLIMMYISIFPIAMSMRQTNVYEEKSLGVWADNDAPDDSNSSYLSHHLRRQLSFDLWYVFLGFFLISIIEGPRLQNTNEYSFSLFSVLFEIVSAYGTVGLSLGYPNVNTSFSGQFRTLSKLIIIAMMVRGRHRGLPYALDRAILLPSESLHEKEHEDATRRARRGSLATSTHGPHTDGLLHNRPTSPRPPTSSSSHPHHTDAASARLGTSHSRRSSFSGITHDHQRSLSATERFKPKQLGRLLSGALSAGPSKGLSAFSREKHA